MENEPGQICIGTCGFFYRDWKGVFYPESLPSSAYLEYYCQHFSFVELDYTWYAMPQSAPLSAMAARTPKDFRFAIKAHRSLTHEQISDWRSPALQFCQALGPLQDCGKLETVLIQLPFSFKYSRESRIYLGQLCDALAPLPLAVEFRNSDWYTEAVFAELDKRKISLVVVDSPDLKGLPPLSTQVTGDRAYLRLHGRNAAAWWTGDATSRYDYSYSASELEALRAVIDQIAHKARRLLVAFNNHARGQAVTNAFALQYKLFRE